jgi:hypothetical protein
MNIRKTEETLMDALKSIGILDKDGIEHKVPVIYGNKKCAAAHIEEAKADEGVIDRIRLPLITVEVDTISRRSMGFQGVIYTLFRQDLNQIIEKLFALEEFDRMPIENRMVISVGTMSMIKNKDENSKKLRVISARFGLVVSN